MAPLALYLLNPDRDLGCLVRPCDAVGEVSKRNKEGSSLYKSPLLLPKRREFFGSLSNAKQLLDTQNVVDPPPANLKVIGGILGAVGFIAIGKPINYVCGLLVPNPQGASNNCMACQSLVSSPTQRPIGYPELGIVSEGQSSFPEETCVSRSEFAAVVP